MIILDLNQVMLSNLFMQMKGGTEIDEGLIRHMVLNSIRAYLKKHKEQYGELIIACDDGTYWRRNVFPYYKANRKKDRDASVLDWDVIFKSLNKIREELKESFPYRVIQVKGAEADDIIGTLCHEFGDNMGQRILILSADKDFIQLHDYIAVDQFDPVRKKKVQHNNPTAYKLEHIMRGDSGDGVPNVLSADDVFVTKTRQKTMLAKTLDRLLAGNLSELEQRNYQRNKQLIDMSEIPQEIRDAIMAEFNTQENKPRKDLFGYFVKHRLKNLMEAIGDF